jgi:ABC-type lipopolysaccharide export system ATPase subunit
MTPVRDLRKRDIGVLIADHNVHEMFKLVDRAYIVYGGRVLFQGTPAAMIAECLPALSGERFHAPITTQTL